MLSEKLQETYSSNPRDVQAVETVTLEHSEFPRTYYFINEPNNQAYKIDGRLQEFESMGFSIDYLEAGQNQQDLGFVMDNISRLAVQPLAAASKKIDEPIVLTYRPYIVGDPEEQATPIRLSLSSVVMTAETVTARASAIDLINRLFPYGRDVLFDNRFGGIE